MFYPLYNKTCSFHMAATAGHLFRLRPAGVRCSHSFSRPIFFFFFCQFRPSLSSIFRNPIPIVRVVSYLRNLTAGGWPMLNSSDTRAKIYDDIVRSPITFMLVLDRRSSISNCRLLFTLQCSRVVIQKIRTDRTCRTHSLVQQAIAKITTIYYYSTSVVMLRLNDCKL